MASQRVRIGCSGWSYDDWRGGLYPEGLPQRRWLERYAEVFDTVEVNATFYRLPKASTVEGWVEQVPGDFLFAVKASRYLTHMKRLREIADAVARFWEPLESLRRGRRLGPVLWQLPENFHRDDDLLASALDELPRANHCFEFRHPSWFAAPVRELLEEQGASLAIGDDKRRPLPEARPAGELAYLRLHYGHRGRGGNYSEAELDGWRRRVAAWRSRRPVFVYLNNDWKGYAPANARYLKQGLSTGEGGVIWGMAAEATSAAEFVPASRSLPKLRRAAAGCRGCPLWKDATQTVFGAGPRKAELMLVGEQPGDREDVEGEPFVGPAGGVLARALESAGIEAGDVYLTNAVKHFKWRARGKRRLHQTPRAGEVEACKPWLDAELKAVQPTGLLALGATAGKALFGSSVRVTQDRGRLIDSPLAPVAALTLHPSAILRLRNHDEREDALAGLVDDLRLLAASVAKHE